MRLHFKNFITDQSGAVTVDWVVLTAAIVIMAAAIGITVSNFTIAAGDDLQAKVETAFVE
ncbi:MAG: hypothetical protein KC448_13465 [Yoonia sp.]|nr:hypothetical protein [Yoonia sp.]